MKKKGIQIVWGFLGILLLCGGQTMAQQKMNYWGDIDGFLQEQSAQIFTQAYTVLDTYPPNVDMGAERKLALFAIDGILHDTRLDNGIAFHNHMKNVVGRILDKHQQGVNTKEVRILRFYNHGFIIQTPTVTIGIDLVRGGSKDKPHIADDLMQSVVNLCDVLFITHAHGDHADSAVAKMFYEQKKEIIVPAGLWEGVSPYIKAIRGSAAVKTNIQVSQKNVSLKTIIFPGYQDKLLNNVYAITTPEGLTIMHTGDQSNKEDLAWIANIKEEVKVDILLVHCWMGQMKEMVAGSNPSLIICGHENEMGHTVDHRESYWLTFRRMADITTPYVIMAWGENYTHTLP